MASTSQRIKGITIEIGGNTTKLQESLKGVNKTIKETQSALKDVNTLLKLDPGNTELLKQKQQLLGTEIQATKEKLEQEKLALQQMQEAGNSSETIQQQQALEREIVSTTQYLKELEAQSKQSASVLGTQMQVAGEKIEGVGSKIEGVGKSFMGVTAAVGGLAVASVKTAADFDTAMSQVAATMGKPKEEIQGLTELAQRMGSTTAFSASEAAEGINILAMAGLNEAEINEVLETTLNLAAAGAMELGQAATYVTGTVKGFGDNMSNAGKYADIMAKGATLANTDVSALGTALTAASANAKSYGQSVDTTTVSLLRLAEQNITGEQAATMLNRAIKDLYAPTDAAADVLDKLNVSAYNQDGTARDLTVVMDELQEALSKYNDEEANALKSTLFTTNGLNAFNKMTASSTEKVKEFYTGLSEASAGNGAAAEQAATQLDNLEGQLTLLKSAVEGLAISIGSVLMPIIQSAVEKVQGVVDWLNSLDESTKKVVVTIGLVAAAIGPVLIVVGKIISLTGKIIKTIGIITTATGALNISMLPVIATIAAVVVAIIAIIAIIKNWGAITDWLKTKWSTVSSTLAPVVDGIKTKVTETWTSIKDTTTETWEGIKEAVNNAWEGIKNNETIQSLVQIITDTFSAVVENVRGIFDGFVQIFEGVWEVIKNIFLGAILIITDLVTLNFSALSTDAQGILTNLQNALSGIWEGIKTVFSNQIMLIVNLVKGYFSALGTTVEGIFTSLKDKLSETWDNITQTVSDLWDNISETAGDIKDAIVNTVDEAVQHLKDLPSEAVQWGKDLIQGFIDGIKSMMGALKDAVVGVANTIRGFLHFSVPDVGPLADADTYMPDMIDMFAKTLNASVGKLQPSLNNMAGMISASAQQGISAGSVTQSAVIDLDGIYEAVRKGASDAVISFSIGDREFSRQLKGMGVAFS